MFRKLNPFVRFIDRTESTRLGHESAAHDCRLIYVLDGSCDVILDGKRHHVERAGVVYLPPYVSYAVRGAAATSLWIVHFDLTCKYEEYADSLRSLSPAELRGGAKLEQEIFPPFDCAMVVPSVNFSAVLADIEKNIVLPSSYARDHASALMKELLLLLLEAHEKETVISPLTEKITDYVHAHFADAEITNRDIAALFGYHPYHISRVMRKETGRTLKAYIIWYRLKVAANMLSLTDIPIADIARTCGFESQSYFSKMFREEFKTTPGEYRKAHTQCRI